MAKRAKAKERKADAPRKTKTPKGRRSGIFAAAHHSMPVIRLQTPNDKPVPFRGVTVMRAAFEDMFYRGKQIARSLRSKRGTYTSSGWQVLRDGRSHGKRGRQGAVS